MNRFVGDGLDHRRPVMSQPTTDIIDLTEEAGSPVEPAVPTRGGITTSTFRRLGHPQRPVIDLEEEYGEDEPEVQRELTRDVSPDLEVLFSRARSRSAGNPTPRNGSRPRRAARPSAQNEIRRNMEEIRREMQDVSNRLGIFQSSLRPPARAPSHSQPQHHGQLHHQARHQIPNDADLLIMPDVNLEFNLPDQLDFETQGFRMGDVTQPRPQRPPPTYDPPPKARLGYTRSPNEDDVMICPICSDELGVGKTEEKRQVWVVKKCGHVSQSRS